MPALSRRRKLLFVAVLGLLTYALAEVTATWIVRTTRAGSSLFLFEQGSVYSEFDPVRGYRLGPGVRWARITNGTVEWVGYAKGNNEGFADRSDFDPKPESGVRRFAVFGDSFTAGQYLPQNWPDRAEEILHARSDRTRLLNLAIDGGGLANWWSVLTKFVAPHNYEIDGLIFAVFAGDLDRQFFLSHSDGTRTQIGYAESWKPASHPTTLVAARERLFTVGHVLPTADFDAALQGEWPKAVPPAPPFLYSRAAKLVNKVRNEISDAFESVTPSSSPDDSPEPMTADMAELIRSRGWPVLVVHIPARQHVLDRGRTWSRFRRHSEEFAGKLGAEFVDATDMFDGLSAAEVKALYFPYDGHWNSEGSNRFAEFVVSKLDRLGGAAARSVLPITLQEAELPQ